MIMPYFSRRPVAGVLLLLAACGGGSPSAPAVQPTASLSASQTAVNGNTGATLTWSSTNATSCIASGGWSGALSTSGTQSTGALTTSTTYSLTCTGPGGSSSPASITVNVVPAVTLTASTTAVAGGGAAVLTWGSSNATSCAAAGGWSGTLPTSGTQSTGAVATGTTYSLTCTGPGGTSSAASVAVYVVPAVTLTASPKAVVAGSTSVLSWSSSNATLCTASGGWIGTKAISGTETTATLTTNTTYSLSCTGPGGPSNPAKVTVLSGTASVTPTIAPMTLAQTQQFTASFPGGGAATWTIDGVPGGNSSVGAIGSSGLYTPGTAAGRHTVAATSIAYPSLSANAVAAVTDLAGVYTYHNDLARDGANTQEYALTTSNVNTASFGKLFSCTVDGAIYGQPLWVANLPVNGARHNVVFIATQHDSLYAFDADANPCVQLWSASLIDPAHGGSSGETPVSSGVPGYLVGRGEGDITPEVGVTGTPLIDPTTGTLYVVSKSVNSASSAIYQRLHAVELTTGNEKTGSPATITGMYPGAGDGGTTVTFSPGPQNQRAGLALVNGVVYIAWAAHEDTLPWYGWLMGYTYNGASFTQTAVFNTAPDAQEGGIWMGGGAPASDSANNLYVVTGNGTFDATATTAPNHDYGDSLLQLSGTLRVAQYFTPSAEATDNGGDLDFGAGGAAVLADLPATSPVSHVLICGGKDGGLYVLNRDVLGGLGDSGAVQKIAFGHRIFATGAYWNSAYYLAGHGGPLSAYLLNASVPQFNLAASSIHVYGFGGTTPSVSAAANQNGIVWTLDNGQYCTTLAPGCGPAVLYANDAANVATELWDSAQVATDAAGNATKFTVPTVANGKVYVGTRGNNTGGVMGSSTVPGELEVYGLKAR